MCGIGETALGGVGETALGVVGETALGGEGETALVRDRRKSSWWYRRNDSCVG